MIGPGFVSAAVYGPGYTAPELRPDQLALATQQTIPGVSSPRPLLTLGFSITPPATPWGINFGGGLNSTAVIIECRRLGFRPDWILFADTGSERHETLLHVERMRKWCSGWADIETVRWIRHDGTFEPLHENCLRTAAFPSKAYGYAGCTDKWKVQPMEKWRKERGFDHGAFSVGYDAAERRRIIKACLRGDDPVMTAWYPLVAWGIDRLDCDTICRSAGMVVPKSSCFMCPNMQEDEWAALRDERPDLFAIAIEIERRARARGEKPQAGMDRATPGYLFDDQMRAEIDARRERDRIAGVLADDAASGQQSLFDVTADRCVHGGCFT